MLGRFLEHGGPFGSMCENGCYPLLDIFFSNSVRTGQMVRLIRVEDESRTCIQMEACYTETFYEQADGAG